MCGIVGYIGSNNAIDVIINGLKKLEYRGYDSAGIAYRENDIINTCKEVGRVANLENKIDFNVETYCAIGHTRWATHGGASEINCHPHKYGKVTLIHNGIIENYKEILETMPDKSPISETDTEVLAMMIDNNYNGNPMETLQKVLPDVDGSYALCIMFEDHPDELYISRLGSPLVYSTDNKNSYIASDIVGIIDYCSTYRVVPEKSIGIVKKDSVNIYDFSGNILLPKLEKVNWNIENAKKSGYEFYMLKEIHDEYDSLMATITPRLINKLPDFSVDNIDNNFFKNINKIIITACGTALHAGMVGANLLEKLLRVDTRVEIASEFRYNDPIIDDKTLVIVISQSGETADTLAALRLSNERGAKTLAVVNVKGSSIAREAKKVLYTHAGPEIAVASTKAYAVQLAVMYLIGLKFGLDTYKLDEPTVSYNVSQMLNTIKEIPNIFDKEKDIENISKTLLHNENLFFIGRGIDYSLSLEGSLKLKEISYIHSQAYAAGELKHGTISLITDGIPVIAICSQDRLLPKMISNMREVQSRGAKIIFIVNEDFVGDEKLYDYRIDIPKTVEFYTPLLVSVILQLIAYYVSYHKGLDVDHPRNLAKSVTVE